MASGTTLNNATKHLKTQVIDLNNFDRLVDKEKEANLLGG